MRFLLIISSVFLFSITGFSQRRSNDEFKEKNVIKETRYYPNGQIRYYNKTRRVGLKPNNRIEGKQIIKLKEYYENGQKKFKEKKKLPRIKDDDHLSDERHIMKQKKDWRKYKKWNLEGEKIEKGKYSYRGNKRVVKYNFLYHKRVIIRYDRELNRDVMTKKKPLYKMNNSYKEKNL